MAGIKLILSTDYEIFGNGSGDIFSCMIQPLNSMAEIAERHGAPLSIFFDVCEYWAFEREFNKGNLPIDYASAIKQQLQELASRGHDIQLHVHPQWLDAKYVNGKWNLNYELWRTSALSLEDTADGNVGLLNLFKQGRATLESIVKQVNQDYQCNTFRAGAWSIQPEEMVLEALMQNGFVMDSTVAPGLHYKDELTFYDFRKAPLREVYSIGNKVDSASENGLLEVPIFTHRVPLLRKFQFLLIRFIRKLRIKPKNCNGQAMTTAKQSRWHKFLRILSTEPSMFRFGDATCSEEMIYFAKRALARYSLNASRSAVVAISHPKTFAVPAELDKFLGWAKSSGKIEFATYQNIINE